jgi:hypothetical protein
MIEKPFNVFSYGSNLLFERIKERIKSVVVVSKYNLQGHRLTFNKASEDGSVKANIEESSDPKDSVWGIIHQFDRKEKFILDWHETLGYGYQLICFQLKLNGKTEVVHTYIVNESRFEKAGRPYSWYLKLVIAGARQNQFPEAYISKLMAIKTDPDGNLNRRLRNERILRESSLNKFNPSG